MATSITYINEDRSFFDTKFKIKSAKNNFALYVQFNKEDLFQAYENSLKDGVVPGSDIDELDSFLSTYMRYAVFVNIQWPPSNKGKSSPAKFCDGWTPSSTIDSLNAVKIVVQNFAEAITTNTENSTMNYSRPVEWDTAIEEAVLELLNKGKKKKAAKFLHTEECYTSIDWNSQGFQHICERMATVTARSNDRSSKQQHKIFAAAAQGKYSADHVSLSFLLNHIVPVIANGYTLSYFKTIEGDNDVEGATELMQLESTETLNKTPHWARLEAASGHRHKSFGPYFSEDTIMNAIVKPGKILRIGADAFPLAKDKREVSRYGNHSEILNAILDLKNNIAYFMLNKYVSDHPARTLKDSKALEIKVEPPSKKLKKTKLSAQTTDPSSAQTKALPTLPCTEVVPANAVEVEEDFRATAVEVAEDFGNNDDDHYNQGESLPRQVNNYWSFIGSDDDYCFCLGALAEQVVSFSKDDECVSRDSNHRSSFIAESLLRSEEAAQATFAWIFHDLVNTLSTSYFVKSVNNDDQLPITESPINGVIDYGKPLF